MNIKLRSQPAAAQTSATLTLYMSDLRGGGAERVMLALAEGFAGYGYHVELVVNHTKGPLSNSIPNNVRLVDLNARKSRQRIPALRRYLEQERPGTILAAQFEENCNAI